MNKIKMKKLNLNLYLTIGSEILENVAKKLEEKKSGKIINLLKTLELE
jgi:hypothetical protein